MKSQYNEELHKNEWIISKWYEKTQFVIGVFYFWVLTVTFALAFIGGFLGALFE